jgi:hypothetical protein
MVARVGQRGVLLAERGTPRGKGAGLQCGRAREAQQQRDTRKRRAQRRHGPE